MTTRRFSGALAATLFVTTFQVHAGGISVPDDFPNTFAMGLLAGSGFFDFGANGACSPCAGYSIDINTGASSILFDATAFDGVGAGAGTSQVTLNPISDLWIGSSTFMGAEGSFFIDGAGTGTLADTAGSTAGHWTLSVPMYAIWNGTRFDFPELTLSTEASYSYWDTASASQTLSGQIMDYGTGDAYLVGEANITDASHPFNGLHLVLGFHGNDPVVSPVPLPAAAWLFGGGLAMVAGALRRSRRGARGVHADA